MENKNNCVKRIRVRRWLYKLQLNNVKPSLTNYVYIGFPMFDFESEEYSERLAINNQDSPMIISCIRQTLNLVFKQEFEKIYYRSARYVVSQLFAHFTLKYNGGT